MANILIVYYSRKGENYWNGGLKTIAKGNTERVAKFTEIPENEAEQLPFT